MKIVIIGYGYVGKAMYQFFKGHYHTFIYDPYITNPVPFAPQLDTEKEVNQCDLAVVCVPTPRADNGECDISIVEKTIKLLKTPLILLKSTVEIGTTERLVKETGNNIVFSPEYCGESTYWTPYEFHTDVKETPFFVFGGKPELTSRLVDIFMPITGPVKRYIQTEARVAELVKYMENSFFAAKIAFCYEMFEICKTIGVDYNEAREVWLADPRINPMHTSVFHQNEWPFSGKCLPKDLSGLVTLAKKSGYDAELLNEVLKTNKRIHDIRAERKNENGSRK